ncbi:MAG: NAD-dependent epimerase/dehydratase family protein [Thermoleophilia bacterium]|nr:NAD-dependent epimerase/dehydratase family protein [Thermoleophilia bacterium]
MAEIEQSPDRGGTRRVLVTGVSNYWGGRLAGALESNPSIEAIIGVDPNEPTRELNRTEYVKVGDQHGLIEKIVRAARIDTVIDTRLKVDSIRGPGGNAPVSVHENNVIGTLNILAACSTADSPVRKLVFKSSAHWYGCEQDDPAFFTESMSRKHRPKTPIERDVVEAEAAVDEFRRQRPDAVVSVLRFANVLGGQVDTSHVRLFALPMVPMIAGFDPRYQFVDEVDVVHALEHVTIRDVPGVYNVAADGVLTLSETISLLGKRPLPIIPPWGTGLAAAAMRRVGFSLPTEMVNQLRFGRGMDNRLFKANGFHYRYTSREAVVHLRERLRLDPVSSGVKNPYRYEPAVEEFLRHSPNVIREPGESVGREDAAMFDPAPPVDD